MLISNHIDSVGLFLDIFGVILLFNFGLPEELNRKGHIKIILEQTDETDAAKAKRYDCYSYLVFVLIVTGFILQIVSNYITDSFIILGVGD